MAVNQPRLKCEKCVFTTSWDFSLSSHLENNHRTAELEGFNCNLAFIDKFLCPVCDYGAHSKVELYIHMKRGHNWGFIYDVRQEFSSNLWECQECDFKTFSYFILTQAHDCIRSFRLEPKIEIFEEDVRVLQRHEKRFKCDHCPHTARHKVNIQRHVINKHTSNDEIKWFSCEQCSFKSKHNGDLKRHIISYHTAEQNIKWHYCEQCSFKTKFKRTFNLHVKTQHTPEDQIKWFRCDQCDYKTKRQPRCTSHIRLKHTPLDDSDFFHCTHCQYKTLHKGDLKLHLNARHTSYDKAKWFQCDHCSYKSRYNNNLKIHVGRRHAK